MPGTYSTYVYKDLRGKLTIGPYWDFNSAFDNYVDTSYASCEGFAMVERYWFYMLTKDEKFTDAVIDRYRELRRACCPTKNLLAYVDDTVAFLGDAVDRNWEVWGSTFDPTTYHGGKLDPDERNPGTTRKRSTSYATSSSGAAPGSTPISRTCASSRTSPP